MITGNESAMPFSDTVEYREDLVGNMCPIQETSPGLTIRQYFAAMAMQGLCANSIPGQHHSPGYLSMEAVQYADALIAELNKPIK